MSNLLTLVPRFDRSFLTFKRVSFDYAHLLYGHVLESPHGSGYVLLDQHGTLLLSGTLFTKYEDRRYDLPTDIKKNIKQVYILDTQDVKTTTKFIGSIDNLLADLPELTSVFVATAIDLHLCDSMSGFLRDNPKLNTILGLHHLLDAVNVKISFLFANDPALTDIEVGSGLALYGSRSVNMFQKCLKLRTLSFGSELSKIDADTGVDVNTWIPADAHGYVDNNHVQGKILNPLNQFDTDLDDRKPTYVDLSDEKEIQSVADDVTDSAVAQAEESSNVSASSSANSLSDATNDAIQGYRDDTPSKPKPKEVVKEAEPVDNTAALKAFGKLANDEKLAIYHGDLSEILTKIDNETSRVKALVPDVDKLAQKLSQTTVSLSSNLNKLDDTDDTKDIKSDFTLNKSQYNQLITNINRNRDSISQAASSVEKRQADFKSLAANANEVLSHASSTAENAGDLTADSQALDSLNTKAQSMYDLASSAADFSVNQASLVNTNLSKLYQLSDWFESTVNQTKSLITEQQNNLMDVTEDAQEYQDMINDAAFSLTPQVSSAASAASVMASAYSTVQDSQSYINSVATSAVQAYDNVDAQDKKVALSKIQLANANMNELAIDQNSLVASVSDVQEHADDVKQYVIKAQSDTSSLMDELQSAAKQSDVDRLDSLTDDLAEKSDLVQGDVDDVNTLISGLVKYTKLTDANLETATALKQKVDYYVTQLSGDDQSGAATPASNADTHSESVIESQSQPSETHDNSQVASANSSAQSASADQKPDSTIGHPGQAYDDFDLNHQVNRDLWGVIDAVPVYRRADDTQAVTVLEPAKQPVFQLLEAQPLADATFQFKINYQDKIGYIKVDQKEIQPAYYWHGDVMHEVKTVPFKVKILGMTLVHDQLDFKDQTPDRLYLDDVVTVSDMDTYHGVNRFVLEDGRYITTNRYFVQVIK